MSGGVQVHWPILGGGIALLGAFTALMLIGFTQDPRALDTRVLDGQRAPSFSLPTLDGGGTVSLGDLAGKPIVINFWSTWCGPCKLEHPLLQQAPALYPDVHFVGIVYQDDPDAVKKFLVREPLPYTQLLDPDGRVAIAYGVTGVPESFFVGVDGTIRHKTAAPLSDDVLVTQLQAIRP